MTIEPGDIVTVTVLPAWVEDLPEASRRVFRACLGKTFRVVEIDANGLCVLDVSELIDPLFGGTWNDIRLEAEYLERKRGQEPFLG